jgi:hypothetical protein
MCYNIAVEVLIMKKISFFLSILLCFIVILASCQGRDGIDNIVPASTEAVSPMDVSCVNVFEYISIGQYKGMTVEYKLPGADKGDVLFEAILDNTTVLKYPEQQVDYYYNQIKAKYIYLANSENETYENLLSYLGVTEADILAEAQRMTLGDLVREAIYRLEGIELSEQERAENYDLYVRIFTEMYGYTEEYVKSNLTDEIYETMRYDKMIEKLILMNELVAIE